MCLLALGIITSGGSGYNNNAVIMNAAAVAATDTIWLLETTQFGCVGDTVKKGLQLFDYPAQSPITGPNSVCAFDTAVTYSVPLNPGSDLPVVQASGSIRESSRYRKLW